MHIGSMRANFRLQRLYLDTPLAAGGTVLLDREKSNYLLNVLRLAEGAEILVFNGRDGEWLARLSQPAKKKAELTLVGRTRPQPAPSDLVYLFAPLKQARLDYMVQKAVEMGAGRLQPVLTQHTQVHKLNTERVFANAVEAAEQCGILALPEIGEPARLDALLSSWPDGRRIVFCDEGAEGDDPLAILRGVAERRLAVLIGPEGGFSDEERRMLTALPFVTAIPLGPRILRADTAAVAALTIVQATIGDWADEPASDGIVPIR